MPNPILDALMQYLTTPAPANKANVASMGQPVDLGRVVVNPNQQAQPMAQPQAQPQAMPTPMTPPPATMQQTQPNTQPSPVMEFLRQMGIPLASAAVGLASPQMLPGAAGMATGFASGMEKQKEYELKSKLFDYKKLNSLPSKKSLLEMAQTEANRQMGGGMLGQARMTSDPEYKKQYLSLVDSLYKDYQSKFRGDVSEENDIDTSDDEINKEWEAYMGGNL